MKSRFILVAGLVVALVLLSIPGAGAGTLQAASHQAGTNKSVVRGELEPGDNYGLVKDEPQPSDDHSVGSNVAKGDPEQGDNHGLTKGEPQPRDDRGGHGLDD